MRILWYILLSLAVSIGVLVGMLQPQEPLVLRPNSAHKLSAVLVYLPGANVPTDAYLPIARALQSEFDAHNASLTVLLVRYQTLFDMDFPPFWSPESMVTEALGYINDLGDNNPLFVGGHSLGAILGQIIAYKEEGMHSYSGVILHSGYVMDKYRRTDQLKVPTITLSGTRDGLNRLTYLAMQYNDLRSHDRYLYDSPAALIEGMNHMQLAGGLYNAYNRLKDLTPTITADEAVRQTAAHSALFLLNCMKLEVDLQEMFDLVEQSELQFFRPYIAAIQADVSGETCVSAQHIHFQSDSTSREIYSTDPILKTRQRPTFIISKPRGNETHVKVATYATKAWTLMGRSSVPQAIQTLNCKLITREQLFVTMSDFDMCGAMNQELADDAVSTLSERTRKDYESSPNKWVFDDDQVHTGGFSWTFTGALTFLYRPQNVGVVCPRLKTRPGAGRYDGKIYCGLVSKSRVVEYVMIDAYRKKQTIDQEDCPSTNKEL
jgi:pimeloyl-ACP methyl ester carboxylesterase